MADSNTKPRVLFVCTANLNRSPTAELMYQRDARLAVRSAGVSELAKRPIDEELVRWADYIITMEREQAEDIERRFREAASTASVYALDIPDIYQFESIALVREIRNRFAPILERIIEQMERPRQ